MSMKRTAWVMAWVIIMNLMLFSSMGGIKGMAAASDAVPDPKDMLHTEGNKLMGTEGEEVRLTGVNCASLEWDSKGDHIPESIIMAFDEWDASLIRLPLTQDFWFGYHSSQEDEGAAYRQLVHTVVNEAVKRHKYILLDLHWSNAGTTWGEATGQHYMPDDNSTVFWESVSKEFENHPNVLFGLYNEPHDVNWDIWKNGGTVTETVTVKENNKDVKKKVSYHTPGMQALIDTIRAQGANNIVIAGGLDWGYDLSGAAKEYGLMDSPEGNGIMLDTHPYPWKNKNWAAIIDAAGEKYPVLVGEFGCEPDKNNPEQPDQRQFPNYYETIFGWMDSHNYSYTAWDFHPSAGPSLIKDWSYEPTPYHGIFVKEYLKKTARPVVELFTDKDFGGQHAGLLPGEYTAEDLKKLGIESQAISSIKMQKNELYTWKVTIYTQDALQGDEYILISDTPDLEEIGLDDQLVSVRVEKTTPENIALGKPVTCSSGNEEAAKITDGKDKTVWMVDEPGSKWVQTDLGEVYTVHCIVIKHAAQEGFEAFHNTQDFSVSVSKDGEKWDAVASYTGNKEYKTVIDLEDMPARYIKMDITKGSQMHPGDRTTISEIEVYGIQGNRAENMDTSGAPGEGKNTKGSSWLIPAGGAALLLILAAVIFFFRKQK